MSLRNGYAYSLIEVLIVTGVIAMTAVMGGMLASRFATSRSIDDITRNIASNLQVAKLKSIRQGVEYRAVFSSCSDLDGSDPACPVCNTYKKYKTGDDRITIAIERGDSNRGSTLWCIESTFEKRIQESMTLALPSQPSHFNPNGTGNAGTYRVKPSATSKVKKCGKVVVSPFGRIRIIQGNWNGTDCDPIREP